MQIFTSSIIINTLKGQHEKVKLQRRYRGFNLGFTD